MRLRMENAWWILGVIVINTRNIKLAMQQHRTRFALHHRPKSHECDCVIAVARGPSMAVVGRERKTTRGDNWRLVE